MDDMDGHGIYGLHFPQIAQMGAEVTACISCKWPRKIGGDQRNQRELFYDIIRMSKKDFAW
jgi:hypothetical protein